MHGGVINTLRALGLVARMFMLLMYREAEEKLSPYAENLTTASKELRM